MKLTLLSIFCLSLHAVAPTIVEGPTVQYFQKDTIMVKWRTTDSAGLASTIAGNMVATGLAQTSVVSVAAGNGGKFPKGAVINVGREHMLVLDQTGDSLTLQRGYDPEFEQVWTGTLQSVTVDGTGNVCTVHTLQTHYYLTGDSITLVRQSPNNIAGSGVYTVTGTPTTTSFTFGCPGSVAGSTTNNAGFQVSKFPMAHTNGDAIVRVDSNATVCYGTTNAYGSSIVSPDEGLVVIRQSINHYVIVIALAPGTLYHWKVQSTPRSSVLATSCAVPGADTVESGDNTTTTVAAVPGDQIPIAPSNNGRTWDFTDSGPFTTDVLAAVNCSDLQTKLNAAASQDGNNNYRVRVPPTANCAFSSPLDLPKKSGANPSGAGKLVLEVDASSLNKLPPQGTRLNASWQGSLLPTLYTTNTNPVIHVTPSASYWIVRGLHITTDPTKNSSSYANDTSLILSFDGSSTDYDVNVQPTHIAFEQVWSDCPTFNGYCKGARLHGTYIAFMDSVVTGFGTSDQGGIQVDGFASQYIYVHNNDVSAAMTGYYQSDNSINDQDSIIDRNYFHKPISMNPRSVEHLLSVTQTVASATAGNPTTFTTTTANDVGSTFNVVGGTTVVAIQGATGAYAALNATRFGVREGTLKVTSVVGGAVILTTPTPHGLANGQFVYVGGGFNFPCVDFNNDLTPSQIVVTSPTSFTFTLGSSNFTTCQLSDIAIYGPVWKATSTGLNTFTIPINSTGFGALTGSVTVSYPMSHPNLKNGFEFKTGIRALISGNIVDGSYSAAQNGPAFTMTVRGGASAEGWEIVQGPCFGCKLTIQDINIEKNWMRNACIGMAVLGLNSSGPTTAMLRLRFAGNVGHNLSQANNGGGGSCLGALLNLNGSYADVTIDHNTSFNSLSPVSENTTGVAWIQSPKTYYTNNLWVSWSAMSNTSCNYAGMLLGLNTNGCTATYTDWVWSRNAHYGDQKAAAVAIGNPGSDAWGFDRKYADGDTTGSQASYQANFWPFSQAAVGFTGLITFNACSNTAPIVCTATTPHGLTGNSGYVKVMSADGNEGANGIWPIGPVTPTTVTLGGTVGTGVFTGTASAMAWGGAGVSLAGAKLTNTSTYKAGTAFVAPAYPPVIFSPWDLTTVGSGTGDATDGTDIGADIPAIQAAIGDLTLTSVTPTPSGATFVYTVSDGTGDTCIIDTSSDSFVTSQRTTDMGVGTTRTSTVTGLASGTLYGYRLACSSNSTSGSFTTSGVLPGVGISFSGAIRVSGGIRLP